MTENKNPLDKAVEILVFAPVGLAVSARELLPKLIERGRTQVTGQVTMARMVGQFAVQQGQQEATKAFDRAREQATTTLETLGVVTNGQAAPPAGRATQTSAPAPATPVREPAGEARDAGAGTGAGANGASGTLASAAPGKAPTSPSRRAEAEPAEPAAPAPAVTTLAIPDYDSLSASQVVPRLSGLSPDELEAVRAYEAANRSRKTILNKVVQLQDG